MKKAELAQFLIKVAAKEISSEEWQQIMVNHYSDPVVEYARSRAVQIRMVSEEIDIKMQFHLRSLAEMMVYPIRNGWFHYQFGAAGKLLDIPKSNSTLRYSPARGMYHVQLGVALDAGKNPVCEYDLEGDVCQFTVLRSPGYGLLEVAVA